jgi:ATP-binding cassette, subfamily B, bacterial MsbA
VSIDGVDIESVNLRSLRKQIGVVTQETILFRGTVAANIAYGQDRATREQIIDAARRAHADEFIRRIPGEYDADILEQGASLSGGQRQRLAIARAILRDPTILILDEATSQIDAESEHHINEALKEFCQDRTALLIAHRLSTVLNADRIVVMDAGKIVDQGRHDQLLERCELYRRLNRTQLVAPD